VRDPNSCRELVIPVWPALAVGYGIDVKAPGAAAVEADFGLTITRLDSGQRRVLVDDTVRGGDPEPWRQRWISLPALDLTRVELCLELATAGSNGSDPERPAAVIENPRVWAGDRPKLPRRWTEEQLGEQEQRSGRAAAGDRVSSRRNGQRADSGLQRTAPGPDAGEWGELMGTGTGRNGTERRGTCKHGRARLPRAQRSFWSSST
jgi:hypothetical protein